MQRTVAAMTHSPCLFHLSQLPPQQLGAGAWRQAVGALDGLSAELWTLAPRSSQGPSWRTNAHTLAYCIEGEARIAISGPGRFQNRFTIGPGDLFFVEQGFLSQLESLAQTKLLLTFSHERPVELEPEALTTLHVRPPLEDGSMRGGGLSPQRTSLSHIAPMTGAQGDVARLVSAEEFSILDKLALRAQRLPPETAHGLHWHPNCAEIGYVLNGRLRLSVLGPGRRLDRFEMAAGDIYLVPVAFLHSLENIFPTEAELLISFGHELPQDILLEAALAPS
jgi:oxalate decarboxylase